MQDNYLREVDSLVVVCLDAKIEGYMKITSISHEIYFMYILHKL